MVERLEPRVLLSVTPVGLEFQVNTFTTGLQRTFQESPQAVAMDADGDFVVTWGSHNQDGDGYGVYAQRYNATGVAQGSEFRVNSFTTSDQGKPTVAMDADGDFVVQWSSYGQDGDNYGIYAQRYNAAGIAQGGEFRVNSFTTNIQTESTVAMDADGDFVVTWSSRDQDGSSEGIYAQRYNAAGVAQGSEFRVNTVTTNFQFESTVAMDADGDFVITWRSNLQDGSSTGVYAQRYNAAGVAQGSEFQVNTFTTSIQTESRVAMDADGDFVVTWTSFLQDGSSYGIYAQQYNAAGVAQGSEFRVNSFTTGDQLSSTVAMDANGDFVVTWSSNQDGGGFGVYAQRYNTAGVAQGSEFRVNTFTTNSQLCSAVAMDADADFVVAWTSNLQDGSGYGVYAQRYDDVGPDDADNAGPTVTDVLVAGDTLFANEQLVTPLDRMTVVFSEELSAIGGASGATSVHNPANWGLTKNGVNASNLISGISFGLKGATGKYEAVVFYTAPLTAGDYVLTAKGTSAITDVFGNALDGNADGTPGGDYTRAFRVRTPQAKGNEFRVNTFTTGTQRTFAESPQAVAVDADGDFVVTWSSFGQDGVGSYGVYAQRYNASGVAQGSEFRVNSFTTNSQRLPAVAMDADGDFVVTWTSYVQDNGTAGVYAQRYNAAGVAQGIEFRVNTHTTANQHTSTVAMDADGDFIVTWSSRDQDGSDYGTYAQRYNAAGVAQGIEFRVNTFTTGDQRFSSVAMDADGDFVVTWTSYGQDGDSFGVYAQQYNAAGVAQGSEFRVNAVTTGAQFISRMAMDAGGDFVVTWTSSGQDGSGDGVYARRYNAAGVAQGSEFRVNTFTTSSQRDATVAMDADGDFVVTWMSLNQDGSNYGIYAQRYNAAGAVQGSEFRINTFTTSGQRSPTVALDADGDFVVTWSSASQPGGSSYDIYAQRYGGGTTPTAFNIAPVINEDTPLNGGLLWASDPESTIDQLIYTVTTPAAHGTVVRTGVRGFNYTPVADFNGMDSFQFTASDGVLVSAPATVSITVNPVAGIPQAFETTATTNEDPTLDSGLQSDFDVESPIDSLTDTLTSLTIHGTVGPTSVSGFNSIPSVTPVGLEFRVNTFTTGEQETFEESPQSVAVDADGDFVVTWSSDDQDGSGEGIYAQRYNAAGVAQGSEFRVNTFTTNNQSRSTVAMDSDGDFIVTWSSNNQDGSGYGVYAQRYNAAGLAQGSEFRVNSFTTGAQFHSTVAMDADGDFVVTWSSVNQPGGSDIDIYAQRYNAAGVAQGSEFRVSSFTTSTQRYSTVAMDADGDFVVTWSSFAQDSSNYGIYAQRYNSAGATQGSEFRVNTFTTNVQLHSTVAMDADGDFVVAWQSDGQEGSYSVYAQRYNTAGVAQGSEFRVNFFTTNDQRQSKVAMDADGDFVVAWSSLNQDGSSYGVYAQRYNAAGVAQGSEFRVNSFTTNSQNYSTVAMDADGDFVVAWSSNFQDGSDYGIYAQRYDDVGPDDADNAGPTVTDVLVAGDTLLANEQLVTPPDRVTVVFSEELSAIGGASGATSVHNPANWGLTKNGVNASSLISGISFGLKGATGKYEAVVFFTAPLTAGDYVLTAKSTIIDLFGNAIDGNADGTPGGDYTRAFRVRTPQAKGNEFRVNTFTTGTQRTFEASPQSVSVDADGDFVVTWSSTGQEGSNYGVYAQRYNAAGVAQGSEVHVNTFTTATQKFSTVAMDADGDFVVTWTSFGNDGDGYGVYAKRFNAAGAAQGSEILVNTFTTGHQRFSTVAMDADGDFVVTWSSDAQDGNSFGVFAQRFNATGMAQGSEFLVNTFTTGIQRHSTVAMDADGDFVVTWTSFDQPGGNSYDIYSQRYNAAGVTQGGEVRVNTHTTNSQKFSTVAMDADGDFVVTWSSFGQDGSDYGVYARRYNAAGAPQGSEFRVNTRTTSTQRRSTVAMDADGDFIVTWSSYGQDGSALGVYAQRYSATGITQGSEFRVNTFTPGVQTSSSVAMDADGDFVVAWSSFGQDNSGYGVYAQRYGGGTTPTAFNIAPVINEDTSIFGGLLWASDPETPIDQLIFTITTPAAHGTATKVGVRGFNYVPQLDYNGPDSFQFTASDGVLVSAPATVSITINPVAGVPQAFDATASTTKNTALNGGLMWGYDAETPMNSLIYTITSLTGHGTVTKTGVRSFRYVPAAGFSGVDSFRYTASDGQSTSAPATMTIHVMPVNSAPRAFDPLMAAGSPRAFDREAPTHGLSFALTGLTMHGTITPAASSGVNTTSNPNFTGVAMLSKWPGDRDAKTPTMD